MRKAHTLRFLEETISSPQLRAGLEAMAACHKTFGRNPKSMLIVGPSGAGKSTIAKEYLKCNPPRHESERTVRPVAYGALSSRTSVKGMLTTMLKAVGDQAPTQGTTDSMLLRLCTLITNCGIEMMILDEIHHVLPEHTAAKTQQAADLIKGLTDETGIPFVLVGLPDAVRLLQAQRRGDVNKDQLRRRFRKGIEVKPPAFGSSHWQKMLGVYDRLVRERLRVPCIRLDSEEMQQRIYLATNGLHGRLSNLLEEALELTDGTCELTLAHFAKAYEEATSVHDIRFNPFAVPLNQVTHHLCQTLEAA